MSLPLETLHKEARAEGVAILKHVFWKLESFPSDSLDMGRPAYLEAARSQLTAAEQVVIWHSCTNTLKLSMCINLMSYAEIDGAKCCGTQVALFEAAPAEAVVTSEVAFRAAVAYITVGYSSCWLPHIQCADRLLADLMSQQAPATDSSGPALELAVCKILLGKGDEAAALLGLGANSVLEADPAIADFVLVCQLAPKLQPSASFLFW